MCRKQEFSCILVTWGEIISIVNLDKAMKSFLIFAIYGGNFTLKTIRRSLDCGQCLRCGLFKLHHYKSCLFSIRYTCLFLFLTCLD